ncbi:tRNA (adenosine(37)-N6)-threonylcarbamoyltransferase complex dimerization subunit type 1 TsaB [Spirochaetia bacterium]|nr:tRNA (adenosine(37)-N6)-threonylcarbamoyltransferase complex dimerization subunit type 1 TsaB [Spirochaetia bacterium]
MNILALDTASTILSAALASGDGVRYMETDAGLKHSEILMEMVDTLMRAAALEREDLELAACMKGPGSFTGLRIGFAAAKGLAAALGIPLVSAPTLDCMAAPYAVWPGLVIPAIDAKKQRFFTALYRGNERLSAYMDAEPGDIAALAAAAAGPILLTGPDAPLLLPRLEALLGEGRLFLDPAHRHGKARELLAIAEKDFRTGKTDIPFSGPEYLRKSDAELSRFQN